MPRNVDEFQNSDGRYIVTFDGSIGGNLIEVAILVTENSSAAELIGHRSASSTSRSLARPARRMVLLNHVVAHVEDSSTNTSRILMSVRC